MHFATYSGLVSKCSTASILVFSCFFLVSPASASGAAGGHAECKTKAKTLINKAPKVQLAATLALAGENCRPNMKWNRQRENEGEAFALHACAERGRHKIRYIGLKACTIRVSAPPLRKVPSRDKRLT